MALAAGPRAHPGSPTWRSGRRCRAARVPSSRGELRKEGVGAQPLGPQPPGVRPGRGRGRPGDVTSGVHSRSGRCAGGRGASQVRSGHEQALPGSGWRAGGLAHPLRGGRAVGRCRGWRLDELAGRRSRSGPQCSGPSAPAPCLSAVEDAGLRGSWLGGRKPGEASRLVLGTGGAAGTPRIRDMRGRELSLGRPGPGRSSWPLYPLPETPSRSTRRDLGLWVSGSAGTA